jgi:hypothetical protein
MTEDSLALDLKMTGKEKNHDTNYYRDASRSLEIPQACYCKLWWKISEIIN